MNILITGAGGQLARALVRTAPESLNVIGLTKEELDITDRDRVIKTVNILKPDVIINTSAFVNVELAEIHEEEARKVNVEGVSNIVQACDENNCILIQISTDFVFDGKKNTPYTESDEPNPINVYGRTKYEAELIVQQNLKRFYIVRTAGLYGLKPSRAKSNFPINFITKALKGERIEVVDDIITSPSYTIDVAQGIWKILLNDIEFGIYHVSNSGFCSWYEFALCIRDCLKIKVDVVPISYKKLNSKVKRPPFSALSSEKGIKLRNWEDALREFVAVELSI